jgi:type IV secretion system protein VirD4
VNTDAYGMENRSRGGNDGYSISQTGRELLKPEEVLALDERQTVVFTPGVLPLMTRLVRYYEREFRTARGGNRWLLALQCLAFAVSGVVTVVVVLSTLAARPPAPPSPSPPVPLWQQPAPWPPPWPGP